jgi:aryl-alcohol dehydrogenase-like predicted oxidoreductase
MNQRKLGSQGFAVSELGLGCMGMSEFYGKADEQASVATLHRAVELGTTMLDTADIYGLGENERLVGRAIKSLDHLSSDDFRRSQPRLKGENFKKNSVFVEKLEAIAAAKGCTPAQLSLAWVLAQGADIVPIPGTTRRKHLEENVAAARLVLSREELAQIEAACPRGAVSGDRYPDMSFVNIESRPR